MVWNSRAELPQLKIVGTGALAVAAWILSIFDEKLTAKLLVDRMDVSRCSGGDVNVRTLHHSDRASFHFYRNLQQKSCIQWVSVVELGVDEWSWQSTASGQQPPSKINIVFEMKRLTFYFTAVNIKPMSKLRSSNTHYTGWCVNVEQWM